MTAVYKKVLWILLGIAICGCEAPWADPPDYDSIFVPDRLVEWNLTVSNQNWLRLIVEPKNVPCQSLGKGPGCDLSSPFPDSDCPSGCRCVQGQCLTRYVEADLNVDGIDLPRVGLALLGNREREKKTFRIRFNEFVDNQRFFGVKRINLRSNGSDPTMIREALAWQLFQDAKVPCPRHSMVWVNLNGSPLGVYTLVEQPDKKFLFDRFGDNSGNLYKLERGGNLVYQGDRLEHYPNFMEYYELKTNQENPDHQALLELLRILREPTDDDFPKKLEAVLDLVGTLRFLAVNSWLVNMDSYLGTGGNLYLYYDHQGRFRVIPWDPNHAFGNYHGPSCEYSTDELIGLDPLSPTCLGSRPMVDRILGVDSLRNQYIQTLQGLTSSVLSPERVLKKLETQKVLVWEKALEDVAKGFSNEEFESSFVQDLPPGDNPRRIPGLQPFVITRDEVTRAALGAL